MKIPDRRVATATGGSSGIGATARRARPCGSQGALRLVAASPAAARRRPKALGTVRQSVRVGADESAPTAGYWAGWPPPRFPNGR